MTLEHEVEAAGLHGDDLAVARAEQKFRVDDNTRKGILEYLGDFPLVNDGAGNGQVVAVQAGGLDLVLQSHPG